jgi:HK97 family phage prohead protease
VDGKLGPLTAQAVKAAQRRAGVKADGRVTADFLDKLAASKSLPAKPKTKSCTCRSAECLSDECRDDEDGEVRRVDPVATRAFDLDARPSGDGRTLEGYVAVFGQVARISDRNGDFDEEIHRGAFDRSLKRGFPVMQFEHGRDPRVGALPIGVYDVFEPDTKGYFVRGRLLDDPVVDPIRQAISAGAIRGMSWRMVVPDTGQKWSRRSRFERGVDKRDVVDADVPEAGPVVFPAYSATTVAVRSLLGGLSDEELASLASELRAHLGLATDLTAEPHARSAADGDHGARPGGQPPTQPHLLARDRALRLRGVLT